MNLYVSNMVDCYHGIIEMKSANTQIEFGFCNQLADSLWFTL